MSVSRSDWRRTGLVLVCLGLWVGGGCGPTEQIRTYTVEKPKVAPVIERERVLGLVIPISEKLNRFVKFMGPKERITAHEADFDAFIQTLRVPENPEAPLTFVPPAKAKPRAKTERESAFVEHVFVFGEAPHSVEMTISTPIGGSLLSNINRWRGQLGLRPVDQEQLATLITEMDLGGKPAYRVDFSGPGGDKTMAPPMPR